MSLLKKIVFVTGTRADYGKLKPILKLIEESKNFDLHIFITGMHLLEKYSYTYYEVESDNYRNTHKFINQNYNDSMDTIISKTISGFSDYINELKPDMVCVHGDRIESLACAISSCLNNIYTSHIEGGEVSGTVDEMLRHSISKLSNFHFVSNLRAKNILLKMGELDSSIFVIGSPETDIISSGKLPSLKIVKSYYSLKYLQYAILIFHPVTTEYSKINSQVNNLIRAISKSDYNYIIISPNNDLGSEIILQKFSEIKAEERFIFFKSMRFEYYLTLLKNAKFIIGNSSSGVREAPLLSVPSINIGSRQKGRNKAPTQIDCDNSERSILNSINKIEDMTLVKSKKFGDGGVAKRFLEIISEQSLWQKSNQKYFSE